MAQPSQGGQDEQIPVTLPFEPAESAASTDTQTQAHDTSAPDSNATSRGGLAGQRFGDYVLLEEIARGGMGVVYKARQSKLNRIVALKMILAGQFANQEEVRRFHVEAEAAAQLDHPGIVPVYEVGEHAGQPFFSMGFVDGPSLAKRLADGPLPPREAAELVRQVAEAVAYAHGRGIVHRDLKPGNILLASPRKDDGTQRNSVGLPRITDFGLAKRVSDNTGLTATGQILGTPSYMAPEQARGQQDQVGPCSDVYALGAILYACLTGRPPFQGASIAETLRQVEEQEPVPLRQLNVSIPADLETIAVKCLEKPVQRRYVTASNVAAELSRYLAGEPIRARPVGRAARAWRWCRRKPALAATSSVAALLILTLALGGPVIAMRESKLRGTADTQTTLAESRATELQGKTAELQAKTAELEQSIAESQRLARIAEARRLAAESAEAQEQFPVRSVLLALEATEMTLRHGDPVVQFAIQALQDSLTNVGGIPLKAHTDEIVCAALSADGQTLVTGSEDKTARVWDLSAADPAANPTVLNGHEQRIVCLALSPDGRTLATGSADETVRVWDLSAPNPADTVRVLRGHNGPIHCLALTPDGRMLVTGSADNTARVWDLSAADPVATARICRGHTRTVCCLALSFDGRTLATGSVDSSARVWDLSAGNPDTPAKAVLGHDDVVSCVALSPDGHTLITGSWDRSARVWDLLTTDPAATARILRGHEDSIRSLALTPDGWTLATVSNDRTARIWDLSAVDPTTSIKVLRGHEHDIVSIALSPDGQRLITGSWDGTARVWDLSAADPTVAVRVLRGHESVIRSLALSHDGHKLVTGSADETARIWDLSAADQDPVSAELRGHEEPISCLALGSDGRMLVTGSADKTARVWDLSAPDPAIAAKILRGHKVPISCLTLSSDRETLVTGSSDKTARIWNLSAPDPASSVTILHGHERPISCLTLSSDRQTLVTGSADKTARVWDLSAPDPAANVAILRGHEGPISCLTLTSDRQTLVTGSADKTARVWDLSPPDPAANVAILHGHEGSISCLALNSNGQMLVTGSADKTARVWDLSAQDPAIAVKILRGHEGPISCLTLSSNGQTLVTGSADKSVRVWDLLAPDPAANVTTLRGHEGPISCLTLSSTGQTLVTGSADKTARVWDLSAPDPATTATILRGHHDSISSLAVSPDGQKIVTVSHDSSVRVWDPRFEALRARARTIAGRTLTAPERARYALLSEPVAASVNEPIDQIAESRFLGIQDVGAISLDSQMLHEIVEETATKADPTEKLVIEESCVRGGTFEQAIDDLAEEIDRFMQANGEISVSLDGFAGTTEASSGNQLAHALERPLGNNLRIEPDAAFRITGALSCGIDPMTDKRAILITLAIANRHGALAHSLDQRLVFDDTLALALTGGVAAPSTVTPKQIDGVERLQVEQLTSSTIASQPTISGTTIRACHGSPFGFEVMVQSATGLQSLVPKEVQGQIFIAISPKQKYAIRLVNDSADRAGVSLSINGIDSLAYSRVAGVSQNGRWVVNSGEIEPIRGWHHDGTSVHQFGVNNDDESVVPILALGERRQIGQISVVFCAAWEGATDRPDHEPVGELTSRSPRIGISPNPSQMNQPAPVTCGVPRAAITVRYVISEQVTRLPAH